MIKITQMLVDAYGCEADINNSDFLLETLEKASKVVGSTVVKKVTQQFSPVGVSVILILAETHISIHTWPEHKFAAVDIFICGEGKHPDKAWNTIRRALKPDSFEMNKIERTIGKTRC
jgi:S-adenosylmethionine decarboxylase proenzyme